MSLAGKIVLIFGGSSGMGKAAAKAVLAESGSPHLIARTLAKLESARIEISPSNPELVNISSVDCSNEQALQSFFDTFEKGSFHHIVMTLGESADCSNVSGLAGLHGLKKQMDMKFYAQTAPVCLGIDKLCETGSIVFTTGALSRRPGKGNTALSTANAAIEHFAKALANDVGPKRVNCVSPGLVNTEMWSNIPTESREKMLKGFGSMLPTGRCGESSDIGNAILYLLTSTWSTGVVLDIDGGAVGRA